MSRIIVHVTTDKYVMILRPSPMHPSVGVALIVVEPASPSAGHEKVGVRPTTIFNSFLTKFN